MDPLKRDRLALRIYQSSRVEGKTGCWRWMKARWPSRGGYGKIKVGGKVCRAHRIAYQAFWGDIPDGYEIDHTCENADCVNPSHLQAVPKRENRRLQWIRSRRRA